MADNNYTALVFVLDRSGSMESIRGEMEGGLKELIKRQAAEEGLLTADLVTFDDQIEHVFSLASPNKLKVKIAPRGMTALFDAIGSSVQKFEQVVSGLPEHARPGKTQVIVVTDGLENASQEYTAKSVKKLIERKKSDAGWDFVFLGANQDAVLTGRHLGFDQDSSMTFAAEAGSVSGMADSLDRYVKDVRKGDKKGFSEDERRKSTGKEDE